MKFRNDTIENIKYRVGSLDKGFDWYTIKPGEIRDIPVKSARNLPLTEVKEDVKIEKKFEKRIKKKDDSKDVDKGYKKSEKTSVQKKPRKSLLSFKRGNSKSTKKA